MRTGNRGGAETRARPARAGQHSQTQWRTRRGGNAERGGAPPATDSAQRPKGAMTATRTPTAAGSMTGRATFGALASGRSQQVVSQGRSGFWGLVGAGELRAGSVGQQLLEHTLPEHALPEHAGDLAGVGAESGSGPQHSPAVAPQHHPGGSASRTPHASARTRPVPFNATSAVERRDVSPAVKSKLDGVSNQPRPTIHPTTDPPSNAGGHPSSLASPARFSSSNPIRTDVYKTKGPIRWATGQSDRLQNKEPLASLCLVRGSSSYPARIRTWTKRTKISCATVTLPGKRWLI